MAVQEKPIQVFKRLVKERFDVISKKPYAELRAFRNIPPDIVVIGNRKGTISVIVEERNNGSLCVVIQGFLAFRWLPGSSVALEGCYVRPDGSVAAMPKKEFNEFD